MTANNEGRSKLLIPHKKWADNPFEEQNYFAIERWAREIGANECQTFNNTVTGLYACAEGENNTASGEAAFVVGSGNEATGDFSHAEGDGTVAHGHASHAEGYTTDASGLYAHAEGDNTIASDDSTHAEGSSTQATGQYAHAEGQGSIASGSASHAEGYYTTASNDQCHAEGLSTVASGAQSHSEGDSTVAAGYGSHAEGAATSALASFTHAGGANSVAYTEAQHATGGQGVGGPQYSYTPAGVRTTNATPTVLTTTFAFPDYTRSAVVSAHAVARDDTNNVCSGWKLETVVHGDSVGLTYRFVGGAPAFNVIAQDAGAAAWAIALTITNKQLVVTVTGAAGKTIYWECTLEVHEIRWPII